MLFALIYDSALALGERRGMAARRREALRSLRGRVLEVGAGTGLNLPHYPDGLEVVLTEPDAAMARRLRRRAGARPVIGAGAEALPFEDGSFDAVVSTMVLCTVADPAAAIRELRRVLRPGGRLVFIEHVRSGSHRLARWQDRLATPWRAVAAGCRCNQPTLELLRAGGMTVTAGEARWRGMPALVAPLVIGEARP
ncbi:class I SAM-dependent methyltransferase [Solirubrobacter sp. CPCC 204708]|uniref:Class I SAM-dependent methyltransferase n=1 Tax=Solirubrobacter deserti TaxID=2282478 RepID=A0ABT4RQQ6_9ACTN|nr:class I SAM-dependent methyltransferase [Solirubrobacter deserti]MBE2320678.1 class I SAM-dependent methyltransferase [Solirubrobacter deserti]MDA0140903.1 class I SAM-dependent methyltransferase [Solirubrobacter deserti]